MKEYLIILLLSFLSSIVCGVIAIPILKKIKAGQTVLKYVTEHKEKNGTPTMGGLFFILPSTIVYLIVCGIDFRLCLVSIAIGLAFMFVGLIDDLIKVKSRQNEGLKPYQKIAFQLSIAVLAGVFVYFNSLTVFYIPFVKKYIDFKWLSIPLVAFVFIAITNSVNLTDGLDGLAGSTSAVYLFIMMLLINVELKTFGNNYVNTNEYKYLTILSQSLIGGILAFLCFNVSKANVFMGDTGSLSLGGFLGAISIFSGNALFIPILGICFVFSTLSVIIQVLYYRSTKKRVFLMAPFHHHLQEKGFSECRISYWYSIITGIMGAILIIFYI